MAKKSGGGRMNKLFLISLRTCLHYYRSPGGRWRKPLVFPARSITQTGSEGETAPPKWRRIMPMNRAVSSLTLCPLPEGEGKSVRFAVHRQRVLVQRFPRPTCARRDR